MKPLTHDDILARELFMPPEKLMILSPDQRDGAWLLLDKIVEHFQKDPPPEAPPAPGINFDGLLGEDESDPAEGGEAADKSAQKDPTPTASSVPWEAAAEDPLELVLNGPAGTGKTTLLLTLLRRLLWMQVPIQVIAPTGKAIARVKQVLARDPDLALIARDARTLHSFVYGGPIEEACCPECKVWDHDLAKAPETADHRVCFKCRAKIPLLQTMETRLSWLSPQKVLPGAKELVIAEEASMINKKQRADLCRAIPSTSAILYLGDKGQVPPIEDSRDESAPSDPNPWGVDFENPTVTLTTIHRQAAGNPIITYANAVRMGNLLKPLGGLYGGLPRDFRLRAHDWVSVHEAMDWLAEHRRKGSDATLLCYTNVQRKAINAGVRDRLGLQERSLETGCAVQPGDLLLCRANSALLFNGEIVTVTGTEMVQVSTFESMSGRGALRGERFQQVIRVTTKEIGVPFYVLPTAIGASTNVFRDARRDIERTYRILEQYAESVGGDVQDFLARNRAIDPSLCLHVDYGQGITVHVSQGSQWAHVGVVWGGPCWGMWHNDRENAKRWIYTASTRAVETLDLFTLKKETPA